MTDTDGTCILLDNLTDTDSNDDWSESCSDFDCIWQRSRKSQMPILGPLTVLLSLIGTTGFVGNIFVILVFSKSRQKRTSSYLILTLAIMDLIACVVVIPGTLVKEWLVPFHVDLICKIWELLRNCAIISSVMILAAIAFDRFMLVYKVNSNDGNKHVTMAMILMTVIIGTALGVPPMLGVGVYMLNEDGEFINMKMCLPNNELISEDGLVIYWQIITSLFSMFIIVIIIFYMLIFIIISYHASQYKVSNIPFTTTAGTTNLSKPQVKATPTVPFKRSRHLRSKEPKPYTVKTPIQQKQETKDGFRKYSTRKQQEKCKNLYMEQQCSDKGEQNVSTIDKNIVRNAHELKQDMTELHLEPDVPISNLQGTSKLTKCNELNDNPTEVAEDRVSKNGNIKLNSQKSLLRTQHRIAHMKTAKVLCIISTVYIIAFLPMFLITHKALDKNKILFYLYFINNAANPIIYSFMNRKFRLDIAKMFICMKNIVRPQ